MVSGDWRERAARDIGTSRTHVQECAHRLEQEGVIEKEPLGRWARVLASRITG